MRWMVAWVGVAGCTGSPITITGSAETAYHGFAASEAVVGDRVVATGGGHWSQFAIEIPAEDVPFTGFIRFGTKVGFVTYHESDYYFSAPVSASVAIPGFVPRYPVDTELCTGLVPGTGIIDIMNANSSDLILAAPQAVRCARMDDIAITNVPIGDAIVTTAVNGVETTQTVPIHADAVSVISP